MSLQLDELTNIELEKLYEKLYELEFNPKHEDDYFNAGGFYGHWSTYTPSEQQQLLTQVRSN